MPGEPIFDAENALGECPVWDDRSSTLWWVDIDGRAVWRGDPATGDAQSIVCDGRPAAIALTPDPDVLVVAIEGELRFLDRGEWRPWIALEDIPGNRLNDGRVDPSGMFWVGSMHEDTSRGRRSGSLYRVTPSGRSTVVRTGIGVTNGLAFSADGSRRYFADTFDQVVEVSDAGEPSVPFADLRDMPGKPDGACIDEHGRYWLAAVHGQCLYCYGPDGTLEEKVELPAMRPTRPTFGGPDRSLLFVTTIGARAGAATAEHDGRLLVLDVGVRGPAECVFPVGSSG